MLHEKHINMKYTINLLMYAFLCCYPQFQIRAHKHNIYSQSIKSKYSDKKTSMASIYSNKINDLERLDILYKNHKNSIDIKLGVRIAHAAVLMVFPCLFIYLTIFQHK